ncbi:dephospho-CoA kinase [Nisaea sp.]|uniref:dephospho-CoA kinase n=1 Tax=Nisaea sp. TaxID=2024842 RepID=UPI003B52B9E6
MLVLGLTGSIGMGKSTAAAMFRRLGLPVHDADAAVHRLFRAGGAAVAPIGLRFPEAVAEGAVNREILGKLVFGDAAALTDLEAIVHPLVRRERDRFLAHQRRARRRAAVLDVPLLFETGGETVCDFVFVVSAPAFVQRQRVLARSGMTESRLSSILKKQMPDREKRRRADCVLATGLGRAVTMRTIKKTLHRLGVRHA